MSPDTIPRTPNRTHLFLGIHLKLVAPVWGARLRGVSVGQNSPGTRPLLSKLREDDVGVTKPCTSPPPLHLSEPQDPKDTEKPVSPGRRVGSIWAD
jgi:hypothetical protein